MLTFEKSPSKFLDTTLLINNGMYETEGYQRTGVLTSLEDIREMQFQ